MIDHGGTGRNSFFEKDTVRASVAFLAQGPSSHHLVYCFYVIIWSMTGLGQVRKERNRGNFFILEAESWPSKRRKSLWGVAWTPRSRFCPLAPTSASPDRKGLEPRPQTRKGPLEAGLGLAGGRGFEPRLTESESAVLPLDDPPRGDGGWLISIRSKPPGRSLKLNACCTEDAYGPCAGPPSCARPRGHRG